MINGVSAFTSNVGTAAAAAKTAQSGFSSVIGGARKASTEEYLTHLRKKYASVTVANVGKDEQSKAAAAKTMNGNAVVIAPNILEDMAADATKAAEYEGWIDWVFDEMEPAMIAQEAAQGRDFRVEGVIIHEDGTKTIICGTADSPEKVAQVNAENAAKDAKKAAAMKLYYEMRAQMAQMRSNIFSKSSLNQEIDPFDWFDKALGVGEDDKSNPFAFLMYSAGMPSFPGE